MTATVPVGGRIITDEFGRIVEASKDGAEVLNLSQRGVQGRDLPLFVVQDRPALRRQLEIAARGHIVVLETMFQPRERAPRRATVQISRVDGEQPIELQWRIDLE